MDDSETKQRESRIASIRRYMSETGESPSVLNAVIWYLERDDIEAAQNKVELDSDKFHDRRLTCRFFDTLGLLSEKYRARLKRFDLI
jgi:hypothetical protein